MKKPKLIRDLGMMAVFPLSQLVLLILCITKAQNGSMSGLRFFLLLAGCVLADLGIYLSFRAIRRSARETARVEAMERRVEMQRDYYENLAKKYEQLRHIRHDCANHCYTLRMLVQSGQCDKARDYAKALEEEILH